jgi:hypothetical protein
MLVHTVNQDLCQEEIGAGRLYRPRFKKSNHTRVDFHPLDLKDQRLIVIERIRPVHEKEAACGRTVF